MECCFVVVSFRDFALSFLQIALLTSHLLLTAHFFNHVCAVQGQTHTGTLSFSHTRLSLGLNVFSALRQNAAWQPSGAPPVFSDVKKCLSTTVHAGKGVFTQTLHTHTHTLIVCVHTHTTNDVGPLHGSVESITQQSCSNSQLVYKREGHVEMGASITAHRAF